VGHEDLRAGERFLDSSTPHSEVFLMSSTHADTVTNVRGQNNLGLEHLRRHALRHTGLT